MKIFFLTSGILTIIYWIILYKVIKNKNRNGTK